MDSPAQPCKPPNTPYNGVWQISSHSSYDKDPEALLERVIAHSSNPGDLVLDLLARPLALERGVAPGSHSGRLDQEPGAS